MHVSSWVVDGRLASRSSEFKQVLPELLLSLGLVVTILFSVLLTIFHGKNMTSEAHTTFFHKVITLFAGFSFYHTLFCHDTYVLDLLRVLWGYYFYSMLSITYILCFLEIFTLFLILNLSSKP